MLALALVAALGSAAPMPAPVAVEEPGAVVGGAAAAGFVGGALVGMPALFLLTPVSPFLSVPVAAVALAGGTALGALIGDLMYDKLAVAGAVSAIAAGGALVGLGVGALAGAGLGAVSARGGHPGDDAVGAFVGGIVGGTVGGLAGSVLGAGLAADSLSD